MSFSDILKKSFLEGFSTEITLQDMLVVIVVTCLLSLYIFAVYRIVTRKSFYSKSFNISLAAIAIITAAIIITIQSSVVISLGMVGALSIVRFRTAIKEPVDLVFLFWSISVGIICGAGQFEVAIITSIALTCLILLLEILPMSKAPMILIVNTDGQVTEDSIKDIIKKYSKHYKIKSRSRKQDAAEYVVELKVKEEGTLVAQLSAIKGILYVSLLAHDGEVTF